MYKNWKEICKLGKIDWCLMMALAHANPQTSLGRRLKKAFPKCYSAKKERGPVPLSVLQERAEKNNQDYEAPEWMLADLGVLDEFNIPYTRFWNPDQGDNKHEFPELPDDIREKCEFGALITFRGKEYIVVEDCVEIVLAPASTIYDDTQDEERLWGEYFRKAERLLKCLREKEAWSLEDADGLKQLTEDFRNVDESLQPIRTKIARLKV